jgi:hypothetical protein
MPQFQPDLVNFGDMPGYGAFDVGHHREHLQFVQVLAMQATPIVLPDFDFLQFLTAGQTRQSQLVTHYQAHLMLRQITNVQGVDLTQFNLDDADDFNNFIGYHSQDHILMRQQLGIS